MRTFTVTWGTGSSARAWSLSLPGIAALAESLPVLTGVSVPTPATVKRALAMAEPVLIFAAEAAGAGVPELLLLVAVVQVAKHLLSEAGPTEPEAVPTSSRPRGRADLLAPGPPPAIVTVSLGGHFHRWVDSPDAVV
jgi:hypothetical protein